MSQRARQVEEEADLGRMSPPRRVEEIDLDNIMLHPRFGLMQQKPDGQTKIRPIDHFSWSSGNEIPGREMNARLKKETSVNGHVAPTEKMRHDTLDSLVESMSPCVEKVGCLPGLIKDFFFY